MATSATAMATAAGVLQHVDCRENLSYEEFSEHYLYANRPVIITGAMSHWKALGRWTPEFFKREFGSMKFSLDDTPKTGGTAQAGSEFTMTDFIDRVVASSESNPAPYLRNKILYDMFPSLKDDIEPLPDYFLPNWLTDRYLLKKVEQTLNRSAALEIYIGGLGAKFPYLHYDGAATHAFLMQIYGRKQYVVFPPEQECYLYPSPVRANRSLVEDLESPDLVKFPLFAKATPIKFFLEPGQLLFVPSLWWHTAKILTPSITVSMNLLNESNWPALIEYVAKQRSNPVAALASRAYLRMAGARRSWRDRGWSKDHKNQRKAA